MRGRFIVNTGFIVAVIIGALIGCAKKDVDPIADLRSLIPVIEQRLNKRDLAGLKGMGTVAFESNAFVIDVFGEHVRDTVHLTLDRIQQDGTDATLILKMDSQQRVGEPRLLHVNLRGDGKWKIESYEITTPAADSIGS